jgi:hypothetical protein
MGDHEAGLDRPANAAIAVIPPRAELSRDLPTAAASPLSQKFFGSFL